MGVSLGALKSKQISHVLKCCWHQRCQFGGYQWWMLEFRGAPPNHICALEGAPPTGFIFKKLCSRTCSSENHLFVMSQWATYLPQFSNDTSSQMFTLAFFLAPTWVCLFQKTAAILHEYFVWGFKHRAKKPFSLRSLNFVTAQDCSAAVGDLK